MEEKETSLFDMLKGMHKLRGDSIYDKLVVRLDTHRWRSVEVCQLSAPRVESGRRCSWHLEKRR